MNSSSPNDIIKNENRKKENLIGRRPIPLETAFNLSKSLCKIFSEEKGYGTEFFMKYNLSNCLITANHVIDSDLINKNIEIEFYNNSNNLLQNNSNVYSIFPIKPKYIKNLNDVISNCGQFIFNFLTIKEIT